MYRIIYSILIDIEANQANAIFKYKGNKSILEIQDGTKNQSIYMKTNEIN